MHVTGTDILPHRTYQQNKNKKDLDSVSLKPTHYSMANRKALFLIRYLFRYNIHDAVALLKAHLVRRNVTMLESKPRCTSKLCLAGYE